MGTSHRVTGMLLTSKRGLIVEVEGGGTWLLDVGGQGNELLGRRVTVEGIRSGFDRLDVLWIGAA